MSGREMWPGNVLTAAGLGRTVSTVAPCWSPAFRNNGLCFPGFFRVLLDSRARIVNDAMKIPATHAVARAAHKTGVARRRPRSDSPVWS